MKGGFYALHYFFHEIGRGAAFQLLPFQEFVTMNNGLDRHSRGVSVQ